MKQLLTSLLAATAVAQAAERQPNLAATNFPPASPATSSITNHSAQVAAPATNQVVYGEQRNWATNRAPAQVTVYPGATQEVSTVQAPTYTITPSYKSESDLTKQEQKEYRRLVSNYERLSRALSQAEEKEAVRGGKLLGSAITGKGLAQAAGNAVSAHHIASGREQQRNAAALAVFNFEQRHNLFPTVAKP